MRKVITDVVIIGSGAAGLNAAICLKKAGVTPFLFTNGFYMGTSRNTGSDKQTYYRLSQTDGDSTEAMADALSAGGAMHGDLALSEAAYSSRCFYRLVERGVPFPCNEVGEYVGYKTDHDNSNRATSAGPLTSKYMTEALASEFITLGIPLYDGFVPVSFEKSEDRICGAVFFDTKTQSPLYVACSFILLATGGPADIYKESVYPESQHGASGIAFAAGAAGENLTESQYGIASLSPRWNLSGSYQQVLPAYVSVDDKGNEYEFLSDYFTDTKAQLSAQFSKGWQWPFDPLRTAEGGSSLIDLAVYNEICVKNRHVYFDFRRNPTGYEYLAEVIGKEAYDFLEKSGAVADTPVERLKLLNKGAYDLYYSKGTDLELSRLPVGVCAQHNNGGIAVDFDYESSVSGLFVVGEAAGVFGVKRPGGSALNSTQVSSLRAAQAVADRLKSDYSTQKSLEPRLPVFLDSPYSGEFEVSEYEEKLRRSMSAYGAVFRTAEGADKALALCNEIKAKLQKGEIKAPEHRAEELIYLYNMLLTQTVYLNAIRWYIHSGGGSRGSSIVKDANGNTVPDSVARTLVLRTEISSADKYFPSAVNSFFVPARPRPVPDRWFENVLRKKREK